MPRVSAVDFEKLSPEQKRVYKEIAGPRSGVGGPYTVWIKTPEIADVMNQVGNVLRVNGKLEKRLMELMVLIVSRIWSCQYQWVVHEAAALKAGLPQDVLDAIKERRKPRFIREDEQVVYDAVTELYENKALTEQTYDRALATLGFDLLVELITNAGRYTQAAMVANAFDVPVPGEKRPLL